MSRVRSLIAVCSVGSLLALGLAPGTAGAHGDDDDDDDDDESVLRVLLSDLSSPKGLSINDAGELVIAQGAFGPPGPVLVLPVRGPNRGVPTPITDPFSLTDIAISPIDGTGWAIAGDAHLYHQLGDGTIVDVLDIPGYQAGDPDPVDHDDPPNPTESNPYGLAVDRHGNALVADAAGNDLLRVAPDGTTVTVARFDLEAVATDHLPPDFPLPPGVTLPPEFDAEAVPTTVTIGPDGAIYVGELKGFPFRPGTSRVWRIKPHAEGAWCSADEPDPTGSCSTYSSGYTAIHDIAFNKHSRRMYVYELAADGVLAFEEGFATGVFPPAVLLEVKKRWHREWRIELVTGELSQPGGVVVARNGKVYVTDGVFSVGRVSQVLQDD
jgi:hypothetical protein